MIRTIDEFENLKTYKGEIDIEDFFDGMEISDEQKDKRMEVTNKLFWIFSSLFVLFEVTADYETCQWWLSDQLTNVVMEYGNYDSYSVLYIEKFVTDYVDVTFKHDEEPYYVSDDRAILGSINEANAICEYGELSDAIEEGMTFKIWHTERDSKVRKTHVPLDGKKIPIEDFFEVGGELLLYPRDEVNCGDLSEIANCRCSCSYE